MVYDKYMRCALYCRVSSSDQRWSGQLDASAIIGKGLTVHGAWHYKLQDTPRLMKVIQGSGPALDKLMAAARLRRFDTVLTWKIDRWGRSVVDSIRSIQELVSLGIRFIAITQNIDTDESNPMSRFFLHVMSAFAEMEVSLIRERTVAGVRAARANGKQLGRPKRVFRRDEVVRLRDVENLSWRAIGKKLGIPAMTALDSYRGGCTETVSAGTPDSGGKRKPKKVAA